MREPSIGFNCHVKKANDYDDYYYDSESGGRTGSSSASAAKRVKRQLWQAARSVSPRDRNVASTFCLLRQRVGGGGGGSGAAKQTFQNVKKKQKEKIQGQQPPAATAFHPKLRLKIIAARSSQRRLSRSSTEKFAREISPWPSV